jgi:serine/threonine protein kinase
MKRRHTICQFQPKQVFGQWELKSFLGGGGNGEVWKCINEQGELRAIKLLKRANAKAYYRFIDETTIIEKNSDIEGIMPMVDKYLPQNLESTPFYVMPIAESSEGYLRGGAISSIMSAIMEVAETLVRLHDRKIYHRDIKPQNILRYKKRCCLADFGLVDYPDKKEVSKQNEEIGPKWTMAPEMRRESSSADASKADVYSLAKTLWIFLTGNDKGFDGQYSGQSVIGLKNHLRDVYITPIDNLLNKSTDNDPRKRPTISEFLNELGEWNNITGNFFKQNDEQWGEVQRMLFPNSMPSTAVWKDLKEIVFILRQLCKYDSLNHAFFPSGGGLDLVDARLSNELGCVELDCEVIHIVKPHKLLFESFGHNAHWNYFRLELEELPFTRLNQNLDDPREYETDRFFETVSELSPGNYYHHDVLSERRKYEKDFLILPKSRHVTRWNKGAFVFFNKASIYNADGSTYDGRHNQMSSDKFRSYIEGLVRKHLEYLEKANPNTATKSELIQNTKFNHQIQKKMVYRCNECGKIVDRDGNKINEMDYDYEIGVIKKFGEACVEWVECEDCFRKGSK